jgi:hypothetical protein
MLSQPLPVAHDEGKSATREAATVAIAEKRCAATLAFNRNSEETPQSIGSRATHPFMHNAPTICLYYCIRFQYSCNYMTM